MGLTGDPLDEFWASFGPSVLAEWRRVKSSVVDRPLIELHPPDAEA